MSSGDSAGLDPMSPMAPIRPRNALRRGTRRARQAFVRDTMVAFGGLSAVSQVVGPFVPSGASGAVVGLSVGACLGWGLLRARPAVRVRQDFRRPEMTVVVETGDLFDQPAHLVVGFCDTFDTLSAGGRLINGDSVQAQLLDRRYDGDVHRLDAELDAALAPAEPVAREARADKPLGKLDRYPVGTVAVLGTRPRLVFGVAYSRIGNDYVASSGVEDLWRGLAGLWDALRAHAQLERVAMPLVGSGLARLGHLDRDSLLRLVLMSFVARSREAPICRELRVVVRPGELEGIDMRELAAFLAALASGPQR
ncbi:macro domain-containing protein [Streptomyces sp. NPDC008092]|uniref:macro domain-containing protein n=1 Tax=Streptomyces sp. NPDC008092 TaxID=3364808 RepID=UPI0036E62487